MFKKINDEYINVNHIVRIEYLGIDEKDNKEYCRVFVMGDQDTSGIIINGSLEEIKEYLQN